MRRRRETGKKAAPDPAPVLIQAWRDSAELGGGSCLFIRGKSLGGRIASIVADEAGVRGLVCLGYPFHPPGKPERPRTKHLENLRTPTLIVQGTRDSFGGPEELARCRLSSAIRIEWNVCPERRHSIENILSFARRIWWRGRDSNPRAWLPRDADAAGSVGSLLLLSRLMLILGECRRYRQYLPG